MKEINVAMMMAQNQVGGKDHHDDATIFTLSEEENLITTQMNEREKFNSSKHGLFVIPEADIKSYNQRKHDSIRENSRQEIEEKLFIKPKSFSIL